MRGYRFLFSLLLLLLPLAHSLHGQPAATPPTPDPGVPLSLARWRASHYRNVQYRLALSANTNATHLRGELELRVDLTAQAGGLTLDWRPALLNGVPQARAWDLQINGRTNHSARFTNEHIVFPAHDVRPGPNRLTLRFESPIGVGGAPLARYLDRQDGSEYLYTLFVPSEASTIFPCLDQPDLKARFQLDLTLPTNWTAIANAPTDETSTDPAAGRRRIRFRPTEPISTYHFAFAAGPFAELPDHSGARPPGRLFVRRSQLDRTRQEAPEVLRLNRESIGFFERYFNHRFPFPKYDLVLIPEFVFGGMEHAGATFLREDSVLFPSQPNAQDLASRAQLIFHETCHQWFGDLVTMRWFDDLWLKEGFANFMAAKAAEVLLPDYPTWVEFHTDKVRACRTDETPGTTPIWQELPNLAAAKSAYGPIVYLKAPAVLRQAEFHLGPSTFQRAVRRFVRRHAYGNASWNDLVADLEFASARNLRAWADAWVTRRGLPNVRLEPESDPSGQLTALRLSQTHALGEPALWPQQLNLLLAGPGTNTTLLPFLLNGPSHRITQIPRQLRPDYLFANQGDFGYGRFFLDPRSQAFLLRHLGDIPDSLLRAQLATALWESVLEAELAPVDFLRAMLAALDRESHELGLQHLLTPMLDTASRLLSDAQRDAVAPQLEAALRNGMLHAATPGLRLTFRRAFIAAAYTPAAQTTLLELLDGSTSVPGVALTSRDRFQIITRLLTLAHPDGETWLERQSRADPSDDGRRYAYVAAAARRDPAAKRRLFDAWLNDRSLPESWIEAGARAFNAPEHAPLTLPFLAPALAQIPELRRTRAIFFVNEWLAAFVGGQSSAEALAVVEQFLRETPLPPELKRKVQVVAADLARTTRIRARYAR